MSANFRISEIRAVMLGVRDLPQALAFYEGTLGLPVTLREPQLALLECGTVTLGLSQGHVRAAPHVAGATEVVFRVESVRAAHRALASAGVRFLNEPRPATPKEWVAHFRDADGHLLSIFGPEGEG